MNRVIYVHNAVSFIVIGDNSEIKITQVSDITHNDMLD